MYIIDKLEMVLESFDEDTTEYVLSHYFLQHLNHIEEITLKQISMEAKVSQASVVRFCQKIGYKGIVQFITALEDEYGDLQARFNFFKKTDLTQLEDLKYSFIKECHQVLSESIDALTNMIYKSHKVMLYGRKSFMNSFQYLTSYCRMNHIDLINSFSLSKKNQQKLFESLEEDDVLIIIDPFITWNTYKEMSYMHNEVIENILNTSSRIVFIGQGASQDIDLSITIPYTYYDYFYKSYFDSLDFELTLKLKEKNE